MLVKIAKEILRGILCLLLVILLLCLSVFVYQKIKSFKTDDFDLYLKKGTELEATAARVLPSENELENTQIILYEYDYQYEILLGGYKMLRLVVVYNDQEAFLEAKETIEDGYLKENGSYPESFSLNGSLYYSYIVYDDSHSSPYVGAYSIDATERKISYLLYECFDVQVMSAESAIGFYFEYLH